MFSPTHTLTAALLACTLVGCNPAADTTAPVNDAVLDATPAETTTAAPVTPSPADTADTADTATTADTQKPAAETKTAKCELVEIGGSGVKGTLTLVQTGENVKITGKVTGLTPGLHGFHVHEKGDLSDTETGASAGGHFNPTNQPHGKPSDEKRHVGDLGNIEADEDGVAVIDMQDKVISLTGDHSIVGKAMLIHEGEDKFTQPVGDAGGRVAFGKIELQ